MNLLLDRPLAVLLMLALLLAGCGGGGSSSASSSANAPAPAAPAPGSGSTAYLLSVALSGSGAVTSNPAGINCGGDCSETYTSGTSVTLAATPASGYAFSNWSGACSGIATSCTVSMTAARSVSATFSAVPAMSGAASVFYTDIVAGPNSGGENNAGTYLTIFGKGFGASRGASRVTINDIDVAVYKQWSDGKITVQPGANVTSGVIKVNVGGTNVFDPNIRFTVVPGKIFFVALNGSDASCIAGDMTRPCRDITNTLDRNDFGPGDHLVIRGGTWSDVYSQYGSFFSIHHTGGTATAPMAILGYPTETVNFVFTSQTRGIHSYATPGHFVIANLHLDARGEGLSISIAPGTQNVRVVNNEVQGMFEDSGGAAAIDGSGKQYRIYGNHVHDNGGSKLYHALYFDGRDTSGPDDIEIAYNHIHHQVGGRGIQIYGDTHTPITNVRVHHNLIHDIALDGILFSQDSASGFYAYNNVVYRTADASLRGRTADEGDAGGCIRFAAANVVAEIYNNTFVDCALDNNADSGAIRFDFASSRVTLRNNIVVGKYWNNGPLPALTSSNNLWFNGGTTPSWDTSPVAADPRFVDANAKNYRIQSTSPAIDHGYSIGGLVANDYDGKGRPQGSGYDIGAFEFAP